MNCATVTEGEAMKAALAELLRLYDWRFELARMERDGDCPGEMSKLLNQYGREKKAAWAVARALLKDAAPQAPESVTTGADRGLETQPAVAAPMEVLTTDGCPKHNGIHSWAGTFTVGVGSPPKQVCPICTGKGHAVYVR